MYLEGTMQIITEKIGDLICHTLKDIYVWGGNCEKFHKERDYTHSCDVTLNFIAGSLKESKCENESSG